MAEDYTDYITQGALARGLDPKAALRTVDTEGGRGGKTGDSGTSFGPFQMHVGGTAPGTTAKGLGDAMLAQGLNPRDPYQSIDFALDYAKAHGGTFSPDIWHGLRGGAPGPGEHRWVGAPSGGGGEPLYLGTLEKNFHDTGNDLLDALLAQNYPKEDKPTGNGLLDQIMQQAVFGLGPPNQAQPTPDAAKALGRIPQALPPQTVPELAGGQVDIKPMQLLQQAAMPMPGSQSQEYGREGLTPPNVRGPEPTPPPIPIPDSQDRNRFWNPDSNIAPYNPPGVPDDRQQQAATGNGLLDRILKQLSPISTAQAAETPTAPTVLPATPVTPSPVQPAPAPPQPQAQPIPPQPFIEPPAKGQVVPPPVQPRAALPAPQAQPTGSRLLDRIIQQGDPEAALGQMAQPVTQALGETGKQLLDMFLLNPLEAGARGISGQDQPGTPQAIEDAMAGAQLASAGSIGRGGMGAGPRLPERIEPPPMRFTEAAREAPSGPLAQTQPEISPPVTSPGAPPQDMIRLYRVESPKIKAADDPRTDEEFNNQYGRWFTDNLNSIDHYLKDPARGNRVSYIELPKDEAELYRLSNNKNTEAARYSGAPDREFMLPPAVINRSPRGLVPVLSDEPRESPRLSEPPATPPGAPQPAPLSQVRGDIANLDAQHQRATTSRDASNDPAEKAAYDRLIAGQEARLQDLRKREQQLIDQTQQQSRADYGAQPPIKPPPPGEMPPATPVPPPPGIKETTQALDDDLFQAAQSAEADRLEVQHIADQLPDDLKGAADEQAYHERESRMTGKPIKPSSTTQRIEKLLKPIDDKIHADATWIREHAPDIYGQLQEKPLRTAEEGHVHRKVIGQKLPGEALDPQQGELITGLGGSGLSRRASGMMHRTPDFVLEDNAGNRIPGKGPKVGEKGGPARYGETFVNPGTGVKYTVKEPTTAELEAKYPNRKYAKSLLANTFDNYLRLSRVRANIELLEKWKPELYDAGHWFPEASQDNRPANFVHVDVPQLRGWAEPHIAAVLNDIYRTDRNDVVGMLQKANKLLIGSMFALPVRHQLNVGAHYMVGRGADWLYRNPMLARAYQEVAHQGPEYLRYLRAGAGLRYASTLNENFYNTILGKLFHEQMTNPEWEGVFRELGHKAADVVKAEYAWSRRALWKVNDVFLTARIMELEKSGKPLKDAIRIAEEEIPNYRLPTSNLFTRKLIQSPFIAFGRYDYGRARAMAKTVENMIGPGKTGEERIRAIGQALIMIGVGYYGYRAGNAALQEGQDKLRAALGPTWGPRIAGSKPMVIGGIGGFGPARATAEYVARKFGLDADEKNWATLLGSWMTLAPAGELMVGVPSNRNTFTGQPIVNEYGTPAGQIGEGAGFVAGQINPLQLAIESARKGLLPGIGPQFGVQQEYKGPPGKVQRMLRGQARRQEAKDPGAQLMKHILPKRAPTFGIPPEDFTRGEE